MTRKELKEKAKTALSGNYGIMIGAWLLSSIILAAASSMTFGIASWFTGVITFGLIGIQISVVRNGGAQIEQLFSGFSHFLNTFLAGLLQMLFTFLWALLFIIPGIVKTYSYAMTFYILSDNPEMSGNDAITESRKMMDGHKAELFLLDLSFIGWWILTGLTFGLLSFYVVPYVQATRAAFYESIRPKNEADGEEENGTAPSASADDTSAIDTVTEL